MASLRETSSLEVDDDHSVAAAIAKDTDTSPELVQEIYEKELSHLASSAKITQYLGVLATRRVRMMLRKS